MAKTQKCMECFREFKSVMGLARHLTQSHPLTTQQYFDKYLKTPEDGVCSNCKKQTPFLNLNAGYQNVINSNLLQTLGISHG